MQTPGRASQLKVPPAMEVLFADLEPARLSAIEAADRAEHAYHKVTIALGHSTVAVRFSRRSAAVAFAERYRDMLSPLEAAFTAYAVELEGESLFWFAPERAWRWAHPIDETLLVFFADNLAIHEYLIASADMAFHAAAVEIGDKIATIVGHTTAGKTTTALALARLGHTFYSDERCLLQDRLVIPFLRAITIREGGLTALLNSSSGGSSVDAKLRTLPRGRETVMNPSFLLDRIGRTPRKLGSVFVIEGRDEKPKVTPCSIYSVLPALLKSMASRDTGIDRPSRVIAELADVAVFRLQLGAPDETARLIEKTVDEA
jgi:hypothetical protein